MEKKLTKAQLKEIEEREREVRRTRRDLVNAVESFWADNEAAKRYLENKGEKFTEEEQESNLRRYEALKDYKFTYDKEDPEYNTWSTIRDIVNVERRKSAYSKENYKLSIKVLEDDYYMDDSNWNPSEIRLTIKLLRKYGYKRVLYGNESTLGVPNLAWFIQYGAKVEGSFYNTDNQRNGIILNIEECNIEGSEAEKLAEGRRLIKEYIQGLGEVHRYTIRYEQGDIFNLVRGLGLNYIEVADMIEEVYKEVSEEKKAEN